MIEKSKNPLVLDLDLVVSKVQRQGKLFIGIFLDITDREDHVRQNTIQGFGA